MNLNIVIPEDTAQFLNSCATSQGEDLAGFAGHVLTRLATGEPIVLRSTTAPAVTSPLNGHEEEHRPVDFEVRTKLARTLLERYAHEQGVGKFVLDPPGTKDRWPEDGPVEEMVQGILSQRDAEQDRAFHD